VKKVVLLAVVPFWHLKSTGEGGCLAWGGHKGAGSADATELS
jgi:hypothetical protein